MLPKEVLGGLPWTNRLARRRLKQLRNERLSHLSCYTYAVRFHRTPATLAATIGLVVTLIAAGPVAADAVSRQQLAAPGSSGLTSGFSTFLVESNLKRTSDLTPELRWGYDSSWNRYSYVLNNPLRFVDPFGEEVLQWDASTTAEVKGGDVLLIGAKPSPGKEPTVGHAATYQGQGKNGSIMGYESTAYRNEDPSKYSETWQKTLTDNTGDKHPLVDLTQAKVSGTPNPFSPDNGAVLMGVVPSGKEVTPAALARAAARTTEFYGANQCYDFTWNLSKNAGTDLPVSHPLGQNPTGLGAFYKARDASLINPGAE